MFKVTRPGGVATPKHSARAGQPRTAPSGRGGRAKLLPSGSASGKLRKAVTGWGGGAAGGGLRSWSERRRLAGPMCLGDRVCSASTTGNWNVPQGLPFSGDSTLVAGQTDRFPALAESCVVSRLPGHMASLTGPLAAGQAQAQATEPCESLAVRPLQMMGPVHTETPETFHGPSGHVVCPL